MKIAVASGKGGTGKTTLATSLAQFAASNGRRVVYADCDVEEPNGGLFLRPEIERTFPVMQPEPRVDEGLCDGCGECARRCHFQALAVVRKRVVFFDDLCHHCGVCAYVCPQKAISETPKSIGEVSEGRADGAGFLEGRLNVGISTAPPVVEAVIKRVPEDSLALLDAPPGTACPVVTTARAADKVLLVGDPTPFGLHDLGLAIEIARVLDKPLAVVFNRVGGDDREAIEQYTEATGVNVLGTVPLARGIAEAYARGETLMVSWPEAATLFERVLDWIDE